MKINEKVKEIIENIKETEIKQNIEDIYLREDLQLSSLEMLLLVIDIEREFHINIEENEIYRIYSGRDLIETVKNKLSQN